MSSSVPLIASVLGPVSNLFSITALAERWMYVHSDPVTKEEMLSTTTPAPGFLRSLPDKRVVIIMNAFSLALGLLSNTSLILNFTGRIRYGISQTISISGFFAASMILLGLVISEGERSNIVSVGSHEAVGLSQGFWSGVITAILYFLLSALLSLNEIGHMLGLYPPLFVLTSSQRTLILQNLSLVVWIGAGGGLFSHLLGITYANGVYFCVVSVLTIGLGDFHPTHDLGRALLLPYAVVGVLMLGLIVASMRSVVIGALKSAASFNTLERLRDSHLKSDSNESTWDTTAEDSFLAMRQVHARTIKITQRNFLLGSLTVFVLFYLIGALIFWAIEDWTYFQSFYFCGLCLVTIGYGDFYPTLPGARAFFVIWSLGAIPTVSIVIANLGDNLFSTLKKLSIRVANFMLMNQGYEHEEELERQRWLEDNREPAPLPPPPAKLQRRRYSLDESSTSSSDMDELEIDADSIAEQRIIYTIFNILRDVRVSPQKEYSYEEWTQLSRELKTEFDWLSDESPIRFPVNEPALMLRLYWTALTMVLSRERRRRKVGLARWKRYLASEQQEADQSENQGIPMQQNNDNVIVPEQSVEDTLNLDASVDEALDSAQEYLVENQIDQQARSFSKLENGEEDQDHDDPEVYLKAEESGL
ncbi:uncharacterized protein V1516DRAFT_628780 [Lipomyces oligophaga]|uniref:uncharacterized protein n=1 Tax=Lipomyces oligophaga TaxID=45792 RepID=UPI0034CD6387